VTQGTSNELEAEISLASGSLESLFEGYTNLSSQMRIGQIHNTFFDEVFEFVNLRFESISSAKILLEHRRVSDALAICRPVLESLLLFRLICNGHRYYRLQRFEDAALADLQLENAKQLIAEGKAPFVAVKRKRRDRKTLQYFFEGLNFEGEDPLRIPFHFFIFQEHKPQTQKLKAWEYYSGFPIEEDFRDVLQKHHLESKFTYNNYLSYQSLKECLAINGLMDESMSRRVEAHYTFLGNFVHPTNHAARDLHERSNHHLGGTSLGLSNGYTDESVLLGYLYLLNFAQSLLEELVALLKSAPKRNIEEFSPMSLELEISSQREKFKYFWFLAPEAPRYDKFRAVQDPKLFRKYGHDYESIPDKEVPFDFRIYERLVHALNGWSNSSVGTHKTPLQK
jgi:hypothetical protein